MQFLSNLKNRNPSSLIVTLFGVGHEKCISEMLMHALGYSDLLLLVQSKHFKAMSEIDLFSLAISVANSDGVCTDKLIQTNPAIAAASNKVPTGTIDMRLNWAIEQVASGSGIIIEQLIKLQKENIIIAVCGSLFAAAEGRESLCKLDSSFFDLDDWVHCCDDFV